MIESKLISQKLGGDLSVGENKNGKLTMSLNLYLQKDNNLEPWVYFYFKKTI